MSDARDTYTIKPSPWSVRETVDRLAALIVERGLRLFGTIDQQAAARDSGLELGETVLLIFENPAAATPVLRAVPLAGLDLPLKLLVRDDHGQTTVSYLSTGALAARHRLSVALVAPLCGIDALTDCALAG